MHSALRLLAPAATQTASAAQTPAVGSSKYVRGLVFSKFHRWSPYTPSKLWLGHVDSTMGAVRLMAPLRPKTTDGAQASKPVQNPFSSPNGTTRSFTNGATLMNTEASKSPEAAGDALDKTLKRRKIDSILPAGAVMQGLNVLKEGKDPVAMENDKYPEWLWGLLDKETFDTDENKFNPTYFRRVRKNKIRSTIH